MKIKLKPHFMLLLVLLSAGCSLANPTYQGSNSNAVSANLNSPTHKSDATELRAEIQRIAADAKGRVGVAAVVLETGETVSLNADGHFPMQSVYKLPIGMAVLHQVDAGKLELEQKVQVAKSDLVPPGLRSPLRDAHPDGAALSVDELLRLMISESDGTASDVLLKLVGGAQAVNQFLADINITEIVVLNTETEMSRDWQLQYRNRASPNGALMLLRALHEGRGVATSSQTLLIKYMTETPTGLQRLKGLLPAGTVVAHKTGTSGTREGITAATNDIGIITLPDGRHLAIAVFITDSPADSAVREQTIAKIAKAVWDAWTTKN